MGQIRELLSQNVLKSDLVWNWAKMYWNLIWKFPDLSHFGPIWPTSDPNLTWLQHTSSTQHNLINDLISRNKLGHGRWISHSFYQSFVLRIIVRIDIDQIDNYIICTGIESRSKHRLRILSSTTIIINQSWACSYLDYY